MNQTYKNIEIILVDDGCTDKTISLAKRFPNVKIVKQYGHKGYGAGCNLGSKYSSGEILLLVDADMTFEEDYVEKLIQPMIDNPTIIGTMHEWEYVANLDKPLARCWGKIRVGEKELQRVVIFRAIWKEQYEFLGGFDPKYGFADDKTFWFKYRIRPWIARGAICYHRNPYKFKNIYNHSKWIGGSCDRWYTNNNAAITFMYIISPLALIYLTIKKSWDIEPKLLPYMFLFNCARYFGNLAGYRSKANAR